MSKDFQKLSIMNGVFSLCTAALREGHVSSVSPAALPVLTAEEYISFLHNNLCEIDYFSVIYTFHFPKSHY